MARGAGDLGGSRRSGEQRNAPPASPRAWVAIVAAAPTDEGVLVLLPNFSRDHHFGPCPFTRSIDPGPSEGDRGLVVFDDERRPWLIAWE